MDDAGLSQSGSRALENGRKEQQVLFTSAEEYWLGVRWEDDSVISIH